MLKIQKFRIRPALAWRFKGRLRGASELIEHVHHGVQAADDVWLVAAQGRKAKRGGLRLELSDAIGCSKMKKGQA